MSPANYLRHSHSVLRKFCEWQFSMPPPLPTTQLSNALSVVHAVLCSSHYLCSINNTFQEHWMRFTSSNGNSFRPYKILINIAEREEREKSTYCTSIWYFTPSICTHSDTERVPLIRYSRDELADVSWRPLKMHSAYSVACLSVCLPWTRSLTPSS